MLNSALRGCTSRSLCCNTRLCLDEIHKNIFNHYKDLIHVAKAQHICILFKDKKLSLENYIGSCWLEIVAPPCVDGAVQADL